MKDNIESLINDMKETVSHNNRYGWSEFTHNDYENILDRIIEIKNLSERSEPPHQLLSDVNAQEEIIIGMKDCEWFVDFEFEGLSKTIHDTMKKNGILFYKK